MCARGDIPVLAGSVPTRCAIVATGRPTLSSTPGAARISAMRVSLTKLNAAGWWYCAGGYTGQHAGATAVFRWGLRRDSRRRASRVDSARRPVAKLVPLVQACERKGADGHHAECANERAAGFPVFLGRGLLFPRVKCGVVNPGLGEAFGGELALKVLRRGGDECEQRGEK